MVALKEANQCCGCKDSKRLMFNTGQTGCACLGSVVVVRHGASGKVHLRELALGNISTAETDPRQTRELGTGLDKCVGEPDSLQS